MAEMRLEDPGSDNDDPTQRILRNASQTREYRGDSDHEGLARTHVVAATARDVQELQDQFNRAACMRLCILLVQLVTVVLLFFLVMRPTTVYTPSE